MATLIFDSNRLGHNTAIAPSVFDALVHCLNADARFARPLCYCHALTAVFKKHILSGVVLLIDSRCPADVAGFVVAVWIREAVKGILGRWTRPYVCIKVLERMKPTLTHGYSTTTIMTKCWILRRRATMFHSRPCAIFWRMLHAMRDGGRVFAAAAHSGVAGTNLASFDSSFDPAFAAANNVPVFAIKEWLTDNGPKSRDVANLRQVRESALWHPSIFSWVGV